MSQQPITQQSTGLVNLLRKRAQAKTPPQAPVSLANLESDTPLNVQMSVRSDALMKVPDSIANTKAYQDAIEKFAQKCKSGHAFDGDVCLPVQIELNNNAVSVQVERAKYSQAVGMHAYFATQENVPVVAQEWLSKPTASLGVDTMVITADDKVLVSRRSDKVMKWPGAVALGFGEGVAMSDAGDLLGCGARCLNEELGVDAAAILPHMQAFSFAIETQYKSWTLYAVADLRGLPTEEWGSKAILARADAAVDDWESQSIEAIDLRHLQSKLEGQELTPSSVLLKAYFSSKELQPDARNKLSLV